jgi:hypothetical protein
MTIKEQSQALTEIAGAGAAEPQGTYTWRKRLAVFGHDCLAHPMIWLFNDAAWAWRFHDYCGEVAMHDAPQPNGVRITGPGMIDAFNVLREHGYAVERFSPGLAEIKSPLQSSLIRGAARADREREAENEHQRALAVARAARQASGTATADLVVGDVVAWQGKWQTIKRITYTKDRGYPIKIDFKGGDEAWCTSGAMWRLKPSGP